MHHSGNEEKIQDQDFPHKKVEFKILELLEIPLIMDRAYSNVCSLYFISHQSTLDQVFVKLSLGVSDSNGLNFAGHLVSVASTQFCQWSIEGIIDSNSKWAHVPVRLYLQNRQLARFGQQMVFYQSQVQKTIFSSDIY